MAAALWELQLGFDEQLHRERGLQHPSDVPAGPARDALLLRWIWGTTLALLEELAELGDAFQKNNPDEEVVDTLHFVTSLGAKLGPPSLLGRLEDRWAAAGREAEQRGFVSWRRAYNGLLPEYVRALSDLAGSTFKWWKKPPPSPLDLGPFVQALRRLDHLNMILATRIFPSAQALFERYQSKLSENHARQAGTVADRSDYAARRLSHL